MGNMAGNLNGDASLGLQLVSALHPRISTPRLLGSVFLGSFADIAEPSGEADDEEEQDEEDGEHDDVGPDLDGLCFLLGCLHHLLILIHFLCQQALGSQFFEVVDRAPESIITFSCGSLRHVLVRDFQACAQEYCQDFFEASPILEI